jgi:lipase chaperone LimK
LKKLDENPELKKAYQTLVKNLPEDQQEKMMANIAIRTQRTVTRGQTQTATPAQRV